MRLTLFALAALACTPSPHSGTPSPPTGPATYTPSADRVARTVTASTPGIAQLVTGHNQLAFDLHRSLAAEADQDNAFWSPFSVSSAFGMLLAGADTGTRDQLAALLGAPTADEAAWHQALGALTRDLSGDLDRAYTLHLANRLFGQYDLDFHPDFLEVCEQDYGAPLQTHDFATDPEGGRQLVNQWVEDQTQGRIEDLLPQGSVSPDTVLVLANAIYFLADWATAFDPELTAPGAFHRLDGTVADTAMMQFGDVELAARGGWQDDVAVLQLPYEEHEVSMVLLIPADPSGFADFEAQLDADRYAQLIAGLPELPEGYDLRVPKFEIEHAVDLVPHLQDLGLTLPFQSDADLTRIAPEDLFVSGAFHKAFVRVDEAGTEAAAATAIVVDVDSAPSGIWADRPFVFAIQDDLTGAILFLGRVTDPS